MALDTFDPTVVPPNLRRLAIADAGPAPVLSTTPIMTDAPLPRLAAPDAPAAILAPTQRDLTRQRLSVDQNELNRLRTTGAGVDQISNPVGRTLGKIGDTALSILAPRVAAFTPGTTGNNQRLQGQSQERLSTDLDADKTQAATELLNAQPELKQAALENQTLKTQGTIQHQQDQIDLAKLKADNTEKDNLRKLGLTKDETDPTGLKTRPLRYEELGSKEQALEDLTHAKQEYQNAQADLAKAKNDPTAPAYKLAQQRADAALMQAHTAQGRLGLQGESLAFQQDKFYNPQPTGTERKTGDLADSGIMQLRTMREIANRRADQFGPGAGSAQQFQTWLGSEDPDAAKYRAAQTFMAEHGAGVFGSRNMGVINDNKKLADQRQNVGALNAAFDQAEQTFNHFSQAGKTHGKGTLGNAAQQGVSAPPAIKVGQQVKLKNGTTITVTKVHPDGSFE